MKDNSKFVFLPPEASFLARLFLGLMLVFSLFRLVLLLRNWSLADGIPGAVLFESFIVGARFDMAVTGYLLLPIAVWSLLPVLGWQYRAGTVRAMPALLSFLLSPVIFLGLAESEFYREFHDRFNQLAIQYISDDPATVLSMVWHGYPVLTYLLAWAALVSVLYWFIKKTVLPAGLPVSFSRSGYITRTFPSVMIVVILLVFGARGGFQKGAPIRWGDAYFSRYTFANHLALNGMFTLTRAVLERKNSKTARFWAKRLPAREALEITRKMVLQPGDHLLLPDQYPLLRIPGDQGRWLSLDPVPENVVLIQMESLSAQFVGALGASYGVTPVFDSLSRKGILFSHFFSQGTHTHQALFAAMCSFPNLPDYEYLMQNSLGQQPFRSLPAILKARGFRTLYVYNGSFTWDNQEGFFRNQGIERFIGKDDFKNPSFMDPTWGVSDKDMFLRGVDEIDRLNKDGRVFALLQTLSNHAPFDLPPPAPFNGIKGPDALMPRLNGIRYGDWALGKFFEEARKRPWFNKTLFVIYGDHGFAFERPRAMMDLTRQHIPLLLYYPGDTRHAGLVVKEVGSEVDILPTVLGLLNIRAINQAWGRDLFRPCNEPAGWAVIKPSGGNPTVAMIDGGEFLVEAPGLRPVLYDFSLYPWKVNQLTLQGRSRPSILKRRLESYVEVGIRTLKAHRAGVSEEVLKNIVRHGGMAALP